MKRKQSLGRIRVAVGRAMFAVLICAAMSLTATLARADEHRVFLIQNEAWQSDLVIESEAGGEANLDNCSGFGAPATVAPGGAVLVTDAPSLLCGINVNPVAVVSYDAPAEMVYRTDATYQDALGNLNVVSIPELGEPLALDASATFSGLRNDGEDYAVWLAILPMSEGPTSVLISAYDGDGNPKGNESVAISGFTFYEVESRFAIGKLIVKNNGSGIGPEPDVPLHIIALSGYRSGGSPRVVLGK